MIGGRTLSLFSIVVMMNNALWKSVIATNDVPGKKGLVINDEEMYSSSRMYSLEDFFWTGSGDGPLVLTEKSHYPTIIKTTTVLATVFLDPSSMTTDISRNGEDCLSECPIDPAEGEIDPTKVDKDSNGADGFGTLPDPKYWLLTVLRAPAIPLPPSLSRSLAKLYQRAFLRQQEYHLGIITSSTVATRKKHYSVLRNAKNSNNRHKNLDEDFKFITNDTLNIDDIIELGNNSNVLMVNNSDIEKIREKNNYKDEVHIFNSSSVLNKKDTHLDVMYYNETLPKAKNKRSVNSIAKELNIILFRNYTYEKLKNYSNTLDLVKREIYSEIGQPLVEVFLYNVTREKRDGNNDEMKVIYWVSVGGQPVLAQTAARDMKLLADSEVVAELGYPITTKAEPYLKSPDSFNGIIHASNVRETWFIIGGTILAAIILLSLVAILACRLINRRKSSASSRILHPTITTIDNKNLPFQLKNTKGQDNASYLEEERNKKFISVLSPENNENTHQEGYKINYVTHRISSAESSSSSLSASDLSQMTATLRQRQRLFEKQMQNEYASIDKKQKLKSKQKRLRSKKVGIVDDGVTSELEIIKKDYSDQFILSSPSAHSSSSCDSIVIRRPQGVISPTSYLSMPSVKSFPRGNIVEPLSRVLEPLSVKHLDLDSDSPVNIGQRKLHKVVSSNNEQKCTSVIQRECKKDTDNKSNLSINLMRTGSLDKDPGVIGPMVWNLHQQRVAKHNFVNDEVESISGTNISKMRRRFSELVDDAFSLFGSGTSSPKSSVNNIVLKDKVSSEKVNVEKPVETHDMSKQNRRHSAKTGTLYASQSLNKEFDRPRTALPSRPPLPKQSINPTLAWGSNRSIPMQRTTSAGVIRRPTIDVSLVNSDNPSQSADPAIPLIQAMKKELDKLPGTSDA